MSGRRRGTSVADQSRALTVQRLAVGESDRLRLAQQVAVREAGRANENARVAAVGRYLDARAPIAPEPMPDSRWME